ncbi:flagellar protein FlhE [Martelella alba]|uniref:Flagellar protein FlhE n=1 Tax=Martelella alba TaxID=2590451 RepID=A0ABY2SQD3_9HYPH|nr:flagellar protein FlhE [Martelella alba]TKI08302.1 flagellar protein FlhE [Martelella alba]
MTATGRPGMTRRAADRVGLFALAGLLLMPPSDAAEKALPAGIEPLVAGKAASGAAPPSSAPLSGAARPTVRAPGIKSITGRADGGWSAEGRMLTVNQRDYVVSSLPLRPTVPIPSDARVTSVYWRVETLRPLPAGMTLRLCLSERCRPLDAPTGRSDAWTMWPAGGPAVLELALPGRGTLVPPVVVTRYQILVNYRNGD